MTLRERLEDGVWRMQPYTWALHAANMLGEWIDARSEFKEDRLIFSVSAGELEMGRTLWFMARMVLLDAVDEFEGCLDEPELAAQMGQIMLDEAFSRHKTADPERLRERIAVIDHFFEYLQTHGGGDG